MQLFDSLSGKKQTLPEPPKGQPLRLFVCGPTVYDYLHIGNGRTYVVFDSLVKYLRSERLKVLYIQNITDIDDKIIARAEQEKATASAIAAQYLAIYRRNMRDLNATAVDEYAPATQFIPQIVAQVTTLIKKGYAYKIDGDGWYFDISKFQDYGRLARRTAVQAEDGVSRIDESVSKRNKGDFCLWKFASFGEEISKSGKLEAILKAINTASGAQSKLTDVLHGRITPVIVDGEPSWSSPLGWGRPGWHIEDTAVSEHYFGPQYDIHGGGVDLKFPHHEAEIAQQESASGKKPFVKIWLHVGSLTVHGKKMSKSLGNYLTIDDFIKRYSADIFRLLVLSNHYRSPLDYSEQLAEGYQTSWTSVLEFMGKLRMVRRHRRSTVNPKEPDTERFIRLFKKALEDDFNTPKALAVIFEYMNGIQPKLWQLRPKSSEAVYGAILGALRHLGFTVEVPKIPSKIEHLAKEREKYRAHKQFSQSDALRKEIDALGYLMEDTPIGPFIWPK